MFFKHIAFLELFLKKKSLGKRRRFTVKKLKRISQQIDQVFSLGMKPLSFLKRKGFQGSFPLLFYITFVLGVENMTTAYDVPAEAIIKKLAEKLKKEYKITPPEWAKWVKTGVHKERQPEDPDWWYIRMAAVLRKVYMRGPIGTERLRSLFGGKRDRKVKPYKARKGSGSIIRKSLQQLEEAGLVSTLKGKGRIVTPKGQSFVDNTAHEIAKE